MPDDICEVSAEDLAQWLQDRTAVAVDCREAIEAQYERRTDVHGCMQVKRSHIVSSYLGLFHHSLENVLIHSWNEFIDSP